MKRKLNQALRRQLSTAVMFVPRSVSVTILDNLICLWTDFVPLGVQDEMYFDEAHG